VSEATNPLFDELRWVHSMIRRDLGKVAALAEDAAGGAAPAELRERIGELKEESLLWQLRSGCLRYCRFVHSHHGLEDSALFPTLRGVDPAIGAVIDRLESEHREVAVLLDEVEAAAVALDADDGSESRAALVAALGRLGELLLAHLDFEEDSLEPVLAKMSSWAG
jgi:iron-sulfur cluster repair protein YtfE (RIC family)